MVILTLKMTLAPYKGCCDNFTKKPLLVRELWYENDYIFNEPKLRIDKYRCSDESYEYELEYNDVKVLYDVEDTVEDQELHENDSMYANYRVYDIDGQKRIATLVHYLYDCAKNDVSDIDDMTIAKAKELCITHFDRIRNPNAVLCASGATKEDAIRLWQKYYQSHFRGTPDATWKVKSIDFDPELGRISIYVRNCNI